MTSLQNHQQPSSGNKHNSIVIQIGSLRLALDACLRELCLLVLPSTFRLVRHGHVFGDTNMEVCRSLIYLIEMTDVFYFLSSLLLKGFPLLSKDMRSKRR